MRAYRRCTGCYGLDIGPETAAAFTEAIQGCKTVFWNGPMGRFEVPGFAAGTHAVARAMGQATAAGSTTIVGGEQQQAVGEIELLQAVVGGCCKSSTSSTAHGNKLKIRTHSQAIKV